MIPSDEQRKAIYDWVAGEVGNGVTVIWQNFNAPRPARPYCAMKLQSFTPIGHDGFGVPDEEGMRDIIGDRDVTLVIQAYGTPNTINDGINICNALALSINKVAVRLALEEAGIALVDVLQVQDLSVLREAQYEGRAQIDIGLRMADTATEESGFITAVQIDAVVSGDRLVEHEEQIDIGEPVIIPDEEETPP